MKFKILTILSVSTLMAASCTADRLPLYKDASAPVGKRVEDLLRRMTLEEKVGQMNQYVGLEHIRKNEAALTEEELKNNTANAFYPGFNADSVAGWTRQGLVGSFLHVVTGSQLSPVSRSGKPSGNTSYFRDRCHSWQCECSRQHCLSDQYRACMYLRH